MSYDVTRLRKDIKVAAANCFIQKKLWKARQRAVSKGKDGTGYPGSLTTVREAAKEMTQLCLLYAHIRGKLHATQLGRESITSENQVRFVPKKIKVHYELPSASNARYANPESV